MGGSVWALNAALLRVGQCRNTILACDRKGNHADRSLCVVFVDGYVGMFGIEAQFRRLL